MDTHVILSRLRLCFDGDEELADWLNVHVETVRGVADRRMEAGPDVHAKAERAFEQIQKEHEAGLDAVRYALQAIERMQNGELTEEHLDNMKDVLQRKADDLITAHA